MQLGVHSAHLGVKQMLLPREVERKINRRWKALMIGAGQHKNDPRETPQDDPREQTDWPNTKQRDKPWQGPTEKDQVDRNRPAPDLEKWHKSNTH